MEKGVEKCKERCSGDYNLRTEHPKRTANEGITPSASVIKQSVQGSPWFTLLAISKKFLDVVIHRNRLVLF